MKRDISKRDPKDRHTPAEDASLEVTERQRQIREAFSRKKTAKITFEEFENMTGEVLGE